MSRWKLFLILILAVVLLHILIIKIFIIGSSSEQILNPKTETVSERNSSWPEPQLSGKLQKK